MVCLKQQAPKFVEWHALWMLYKCLIQKWSLYSNLSAEHISNLFFEMTTNMAYN